MPDSCGWWARRRVATRAVLWDGCGRTGRRARCEDRIRAAKDTGLRNLPLHDFTQNQIWAEIVALACELLSWMQMLALQGHARRYESKRLRLAAHWPWPSQLTTAIARLRALPAPT